MYAATEVTEVITLDAHCRPVGRPSYEIVRHPETRLYGLMRAVEAYEISPGRWWGVVRLDYRTNLAWFAPMPLNVPLRAVWIAYRFLRHPWDGADRWLRDNRP